MVSAVSGYAEGSGALTDLILLIFRVNGRLLQAGDQLVAPLGLTSARWQLMGTIAEARTALTVAGLAREMGVTRQATQRIANDLVREGTVAFHPNPKHKRAPLIVLTDRGRDVYEQALALQKPWASELSKGLSTAELSAASAVMSDLLARLGRASDRQTA